MNRRQLLTFKHAAEEEMMVDEMGDFYYQMLMTMADTFKRATQQEALSEEMKAFAKGFIKKFQESQIKL